MTDGLSKDEILSKYYDYLRLDWVKLLQRHSSIDSNSASSIDSWRDLSDDDIIRRSLVKRNKNERLSEDQIKFLRNQIDHSWLTIREISSNFYISTSSLRRIKSLSYFQLWRGPMRPPLKLHAKEHFLNKREIEFYNKNWEYPYTVGDVKEYIDDEFDRNFPARLVRKVMINDLRLRFKKWKSRPFAFNVSKIKASRKLFCAHFIDRLEPSTLIVNIDESTLVELLR